MGRWPWTSGPPSSWRKGARHTGRRRGRLVDARSPAPDGSGVPPSRGQARGVGVRPAVSAVARERRRAAQSLTWTPCEACSTSRVLVEDFMVGREIDVAVLRDTPADSTVVGAALEIVVATGEVFEHEPTSTTGDPTFLLPAPVSPAEADDSPRRRARYCSTRSAAAVSPLFDFFLAPRARTGPQRGQHDAQG